jgi:nucleotide-binding universal stress UspA family protein
MLRSPVEIPDRRWTANETVARERVEPVDDRGERALAADEAAHDRTKIVVGYDGSEAAMRAVERAAVLAGDQSRLVVIGVAEPYPRSGITIPANRDAFELQRRRRELEAASRFLANRGIEAETVTERGDAADVLVAASRDADLLIVGSRKLNRFERLLLGSVSSKLVHDAECDVLVVR